MNELSKLGFKLKEETIKRCKIFQIAPEKARQFVPVSPELFHFLYEVKKVAFNIYFRVEDTMIEFIQSHEFSKELLDQLWSSMQKNRRRLELNILRSEFPKFQELIDQVRSQKVNRLLEKFPHLDKKTLDVFSNLSTASQMIVKGGINSDVVAQVRASASYVVNNLLDSSLAVATLSKMVTADPTLYDHSAAVAMIASMIGMHCLPKAMPPKQAEIVAKCGLYHDVGKTCVPSAILNKPGKFTPEEFEVMKSHAELGEKELEAVRNAGAQIEPECVRVAGEHHEKFAGTGYPRRRAGRLEEDAENGIHLYSRIVTIADIYSALLMKRVYKEAYEPQDAIKTMAETAANDYDPDLFHNFLKTVVNSLNTYQGKMSGGKGRILFFDDEGKLRETQKPKVA